MQLKFIRPIQLIAMRISWSWSQVFAFRDRIFDCPKNCAKCAHTIHTVTSNEQMKEDGKKGGNETFNGNILPLVLN